MRRCWPVLMNRQLVKLVRIPGCYMFCVPASARPTEIKIHDSLCIAAEGKQVCPHRQQRNIRIGHTCIDIMVRAVEIPYRAE